jgi:hypothetical protein
VSRLARQLGYKVGSAVASSVDISVAIETTGGFAFPVVLPKGFQLQGPNELIFETAEEVTFTAGSGPTMPLTVPCYEGETIVENFVSDGLTNQVFNLERVPDEKNLVKGTVRAVVNGAEWAESDFISFDKTDQYEIGYNDEPPTLRFGDGIAGNVPPLGAPIAVTYVASRGRAGQISAGTINDVVTDLVSNFTTIPLVVNNEEASVGGDDPEALSKVRAYAGKVFKSRQVAVTRPDYKALSGSFADPLYGRVAVAQAISTRSSEQDLFLQNVLHDIDAALTPVKNNVNTLTGSGRTALGGIETLLADLLTALEDAAAAMTTADAAVSAALTSARTQKNASVELYNDATDVVTEAALGSSALGVTAVATANLAIGVGPSRVLYIAKVPGAVGASVRVTHVAGGVLAVGVVANDITVTVAPANTAAAVAAAVMAVPAAAALVDAYALGAASGNPPAQALTNLGYDAPNSIAVSGLKDTDQSLLLKRFDRCKTEASNIQTAATAMQADFDSVIIQGLLDTQIQVNDTGLDLTTPGTHLFDAEAARAATVTAVGILDPATGLYVTFNDIDAAVLPLDTTGVVAISVGASLDDLEAHVDAYLSADCKSNLVTVPILTKNAAGFYAAPSLGLQRSLQAYLDARKEVTQTVKVTSGAIYLVGAKLTLRIGVKEGFAESVVRTGVLTVVDGLLKDRDFGVDLYLSDVIDTVKDSVDGVAFVNCTIDGYYDVNNVLQIDKLDVDGNLIVNISEVITKGTPTGSVTVNTEIVVAE